MSQQRQQEVRPADEVCQGEVASVGLMRAFFRAPVRALYSSKGWASGVEGLQCRAGGLKLKFRVRRLRLGRAYRERKESSQAAKTALSTFMPSDSANPFSTLTSLNPKHL